jgi:hypothetical protein
MVFNLAFRRCAPERRAEEEGHPAQPFDDARRNGGLRRKAIRFSLSTMRAGTAG